MSVVFLGTPAIMTVSLIVPAVTVPILFADPDRVVFPVTPNVVEQVVAPLNVAAPVTPKVPPTVALPEALMVVAATEEGVDAPTVVASICPPFIFTVGIVVVSSEDNTIFAVPELLGCLSVSKTNIRAILLTSVLVCKSYTGWDLSNNKGTKNTIIISSTSGMSTAIVCGS